MRQGLKTAAQFTKLASTQATRGYSSAMTGATANVTNMAKNALTAKKAATDKPPFMQTRPNPIAFHERFYSTEIQQRVRNDAGELIIKKNGKIITVQYNHVGRDKHQDEDANTGTAYENPWYDYLLSVWNGLKKPGDVEIGGQEYGKAIESARRSPADNLTRVAKNTPKSRKRSLGRGGFANAVYALHPNDAKECYAYVKKYGVNAFIKLFDYNVNWEEMEEVIEIISNMFETFEFALPHSPDSNKEFQTLKSEEIAEKLQELRDNPNNTVTEVEASIKRMVKGMTKEEAIESADIMVPELLRRGINKVTLHAHGESASAACAAFIARCAEYGINVGVDVVPEVEEGEAAFPTIQKITKILKEEYNIDMIPQGEDKDRLTEVARIQNIIDKSLKAVKVKIADYWSEDDMSFMGMPSGGALHFWNDIMGSTLFADLGLDSTNQDHIKQLCQIIKYTYRQSRNDDGEINSVTPGHKREGDKSIKATQNIASDIKEYAKSLDKTVATLDESDRRHFYEDHLKIFSKHKLYHGMSPDFTDALRNAVGDRLVYPKKLSEEVKDFICEEHMGNFLAQAIFKDLPTQVKNDLIEASRSKDQVKDIMTQFFVSEEGIIFLAKAHMNEMLSKQPFDSLHHSIVKELKEHASSSFKGSKTLDHYIKNRATEAEKSQLTAVVSDLHKLYDTQPTRDKIMTRGGKLYGAYDIEGAAGEREYTEASKATELGPKMEAELIELGYSGENLFKKKVEGILSKTFFHANLDKAPAPNPHGIPKARFQNEQRLDAASLEQRLQARSSALTMDSAISATNPEGFAVDPVSFDFKYDPTGEHAQACATFVEKQNWTNAIAGATHGVTQGK